MPVPVSKSIPMHLIDDPEVLMRTNAPDEYLRSLADDIARNGLTNPISVRRDGQRYKLIAGWCRKQAHQLLGREQIEVRDYSDDVVSDEAIKFGENFYRQDVSDADMATYLSDLQLRFHYDMSTLVGMTGRSEGWINMRLALFRGNPAVFEALRLGQIKLSHAVELNTFPPDYQAYYLQMAIQSTPPLRVLQDWHRQCILMNLPATQQTEQQPAQEQQTPAPGVVIESCCMCDSNQLPWLMKFYRIHEHCFDMIKKSIADQMKGQ